MSVRPTTTATADTSEPSPLITTPNSPSQFTYTNLEDLTNPTKSYLLPLSTIGLIDLNAFFAQVEQIRLGLDYNKPIVCAQWNSIIAVNYPAREFGIGRMDSIESAKKKCPNLIIAHAAVYKKGNEYWSYVDGLPHAKDHKVSLDSYRRESRKILRIIMEKFEIVEKASVDECYIDFGNHIYHELIKLFPELDRKDNENEQLLPDIPKVLPIELQWFGEIYPSEIEQFNPNDSSQGQQSPSIQDWDDICLLIGSRILFELRKEIFNELGYTTSAGLSRNKLISKLSGGFKKPDNQTIIKNSSINNFLNNFELTDISGMGGKLGDSIINKLDIPPQFNSIKYIRDNFTISQLNQELEDLQDPKLGERVYLIVRGIYPIELTPRIEIKSMMSAKNFRNGSIKNLKDSFDWIKVFSGDLYNRLIDLDNENLQLSITKLSTRSKGLIIKRPKTLTISIVLNSSNKSTRQMKIPIYKDLQKMKSVFYQYGCLLLKEYLEFNTNIDKLNGGLSTKELFKKDPKDIKIMDLQLLSLTGSNFVEIDENSLIENFATKSNNNDLATKELMELNAAAAAARQEHQQEQLRQPQKRKELSDNDRQYIAKLFKELEDENGTTKAASSFSSSLLPPKPKRKELSDNDRQYIAKLFKELEDEKKNSSPSPPPPPPPSSSSSSGKRKHNQMDIFQTLLKKKSNALNLLDELIKTKKCPKCNITIDDDPIEHNDFHIALDLSNKLNN